MTLTYTPEVTDCLQEARRLKQEGDLAGAIATYYQAIELDGNHADALLECADLEFGLNHLEAAQGLYERLQSLPVSFPVVDFQLGRIAHSQGRGEDALRLYGQAIEKDPGWFPPYEFQGEVQFDANELALAAQSYQKAVELGSCAPWVRFKLGQIAHRQGEFEQALACYTEATELDANWFPPYEFMGEILFERDQLDQAQMNYEKAIALGSQAPWAHVKLGKIAERGNQTENAIEQYEKALALNPSDVGLTYHVGELLQQQGWFDKAKFYYENALNLDPDFAKAEQALRDLSLSQPSATKVHSADLTPQWDQAPYQASYSTSRTTSPSSDANPLQAIVRFFQRLFRSFTRLFS
jgi:tetratricopeptide (TPR) repeat protein